MPGSRGRNFRGGDLAEGLGLELLRPFAFIAPVPRTEDIGIDAVATIFRRETHRIIAEDSFLVQVKATSVRKIEYKGEQLNWLRALSLPCYWMSVDLATTTVELWPMIRATNHPNYRDCKAVTMYLDESPFDHSVDEMHVWLEKPILRWTPTDAANPNFQLTVYDVLKAWIGFDMKCLAVRTLGMTFPVTWEIGSKPQRTDAYIVMHDPRQLKTILEEIRPHIQALSALSWQSLLGPTNNSANNLFVGLLLVYNYMRQHGVDPDPHGNLNVLAQILQRQNATKTDADSSGQGLP